MSSTPPEPAHENVARYLPLSQRPRRDESGVSADWSTHTGTLLTQLASAVDQLDEAGWHSPSLRSGVTIGDVVVETLGRLTSTRLDRMLRRPAARPGRDQASSALRAVVPRRGIGDLSVVVVAAYELAVAPGAQRVSPIVVDPIASGAVALARSLSAPLPERAVVRGTTLAASDADWRVGTGPVVVGTASAIVLFLFGRGPVPPRA